MSTGLTFKDYIPLAASLATLLAVFIASFLTYIFGLKIKKSEILYKERLDSFKYLAGNLSRVEFLIREAYTLAGSKDIFADDNISRIKGVVEKLIGELDNLTYSSVHQVYFTYRSRVLMRRISVNLSALVGEYFIISNFDDDFTRSASHLRSFQDTVRGFSSLLEEQIIECTSSLYKDIGPTKYLGQMSQSDTYLGEEL